ncbi:MAG: ATP-binding protein [Sandaracinus sp.]|nr:ATP-binding protein [Sandaracinus sp.]
MRAEGERVTLEVRDDGPGFPADLAVFDRFVSTRAGGTGIGLALVAAVARSHGGHARVGEGEGGRVVLTLARRAP